MKRRIFCLILILLLPIVAQATTYYVRHTDSCGTCGDDENGLTPSTAWITIGKATDTMIAGDSVWIGAGDFSGETMVLSYKDYGSWTHFIGDYDGS